MCFNGFKSRIAEKVIYWNKPCRKRQENAVMPCQKSVGSDYLAVNFFASVFKKLFHLLSFVRDQGDQTNLLKTSPKQIFPTNFLPQLTHFAVEKVVKNLGYFCN
jgi:hypothetical protein